MADRDRSPTHRRRDALAWGAVGFFAFLVLIQGFELATTARVDWRVKAAVALFVGIGATGLSVLVGRWLAGR